MCALGLQGRIPTELGQLSALINLFAARNVFKGSCAQFQILSKTQRRRIAMLSRALPFCRAHPDGDRPTAFTAVTLLGTE